MSERSTMREFWDARAREDAYFFVDDRQTYGAPDPDGFWAEGAALLDYYGERLGARIRPRDAVVEIGCGIGRLTRPLAGRARRVYALDVSREMLDRARAEHPDLENVEWLLSSGLDLEPVSDASVDACFSHVVFQHIPDPAVTLGYVREMGRVLRPGGWAAFQVSNSPTIHGRRAGRLVSRLRRLLGRAAGPRDHPAWLGSAVDLHELAAVASQALLEVEQVEGRGTQFCLVMLRRRDHPA